jgi:hypothetical protein
MPLLDDIKKYFAIFSPALAAIPGVGVAMPFVNMAFVAIGEAEQALGPGTGPQKLEHAVNATADAINIYNAAMGKNFNTSEMMSAITDMVNAGVRFCNAVGAFKKSS